MSIYADSRHNYWYHRIGTIYKLSLLNIVPVEARSIIDTRASAAIAFFQLLMANPNHWFDTDNFDAIPINHNDVIVLSITVNDYLGATRILLIARRVKYIN